MRDRGKREVEAYMNNNNGEYYGGETMPEFPCKKHPASASSSAGGICAYCLTDRLAQLVCPQCGEQRLSSSCACVCTTDTLFNSTNNTSNVPDVGRISFLLENDQRGAADISGSKSRYDQPRLSNYSNYSNNDEFITSNLRRSSSISAAATDVMMSKGKNNKGSSSSETGKLWKIGRLFRKKKDKSSNNPSKNSGNNNNNNTNNNNNNNEENYECNGVSRSRSLCSFRGFYDPEDQSGGFHGGSISAARASSVSTGNFMPDSAKMSCFSESEARISNFDYYDASNFVGNKNNNNNNNTNNIFSLKETEFVSCDDPAFIDLTLNESSNNSNNNNNYSNYNYTSNNSNNVMSSDYNYNYNYSSRAPPDLAAMRRSGFGLSTREYGYRGGGGGGGHDVMNLGHEMFRNGSGSCRISDVSERDLRKCRKSYKVWKWFSKHPPPPPHSSSSSKFDDHDFKS